MDYLRIKHILIKLHKYACLTYEKLFCEEILVLGDSHANIFNHINKSSFFPRYSFRVIAVRGATVSGLENPNSKTKALPIFMDNLSKSRAKIAITLIGEVDTGFLIWYRAEKYSTPVSEMLKQALKNYQKLLLILSKKYNVICISTPLSTIKDNISWGKIANARKECKATQLERTTLTLEFNKRMNTFCCKNDIDYFSFDEILLGKNGLVSDKLLNEYPADHHYSQGAYAEMINSRLKMYIEPAVRADQKQRG